MNPPLSRSSETTRRDFVVSTLSAGFALAVQPVMATAISTNSNNLKTEVVQIPVADGTIPAYQAMPDRGKNFPVVLVVQEIFGVHEHIKDVCRRLAKLGYLALAPELYARQGDVTKLSKIEDILQVVKQVPDAQVLSDLDASVAYLKNMGQADLSKLAITGFCWGGRIVWLYANHNPQVKAGIAWYGPLTGEKTALKPQFPLDITSTLKVPVLGLYSNFQVKELY